MTQNIFVALYIIFLCISKLPTPRQIKYKLRAILPQNFGKIKNSQPEPQLYWFLLNQWWRQKKIAGGIELSKCRLWVVSKNLCRQCLSYCLLKRVNKGPGFYEVPTMHRHLGAHWGASKNFGGYSPSSPSWRHPCRKSVFYFARKRVYILLLVCLDIFGLFLDDQCLYSFRNARLPNRGGSRAIILGGLNCFFHVTSFVTL